MAMPSTVSRFPGRWPARIGGGLRGLASRAPVLLFLVAGVVLPFVVGDYWTFNVTVGLILAVSCLGLRVLTGWAGQISLMQAGLTGTAVYVEGHLFTTDGSVGDIEVRHHYLYSAAVTIAVTMAVSVAVALFGARGPLICPIAATFAAQYLIEKTILRSDWFTLTRGLSGPLPTPRGFLGLSLETDRRYYFYAFVVLLAVLAGVHRLRHSRYGRAMIAVGNDPVSAAAHGISPTRARVGAFAVAGLLAGVAGVLFVPFYAQPRRGPFSGPGTSRWCTWRSPWSRESVPASGWSSSWWR